MPYHGGSDRFRDRVQAIAVMLVCLGAVPMAIQCKPGGGGSPAPPPAPPSGATSKVGLRGQGFQTATCKGSYRVEWTPVGLTGTAPAGAVTSKVMSPPGPQFRDFDMPSKQAGDAWVCDYEFEYVGTLAPGRWQIDFVHSVAGVTNSCQTDLVAGTNWTAFSSTAAGCNTTTGLTGYQYP